MPAHNSEFPWLSYYGHYQFFENQLSNHNKVSRIKVVSTGLYDITLTNGQTLRVFICECYSFGGAEYVETVQKLGHVDSVVINSNWCGYSLPLKMECMEDRVGIFDIKGFMAAIHKKNYWEYMTEDEKESTNR